MAEHTLTVRAHRRPVHKDLAELWLACPDCPLTVHATIRPASQADHLINTLTDAHREQMGQTRHVVDLRPDGWTIQHPLACRPNLFDCPVNRAAERGLRERPPVPDGWYVCSIGETGGLIVGGRVDTDE